MKWSIWISLYLPFGVRDPLIGLSVPLLPLGIISGEGVNDRLVTITIIICILKERKKREEQYTALKKAL